MTTEIDAGRVRPKRDPGRCFVRAGWERLYTTNGAAKGRRDLIVFGAPIHNELAALCAFFGWLLSWIWDSSRAEAAE
jgi:hypothetical protein